ncbi:ESX secretion-associated protein EspG [Nocardia farcinica]|uniref:ESX secretion-associated protein EspG n=1 Tax=Nocardia farcinica TaxID=37329 RepID=UPI0024587C7E|nr:ESX secretion-associated protein EspG [Nocardia farcinica]
MRWVLTPDEFTHVWESETNLDRRPYPVNMMPASLVRTEAEHASLRLPQRFARQADPDLAAALMLCARGDATTITVSGERHTPGRNGDGENRVLIFAAVVHQHAGILIAGREKMTVLMCHARMVGARLVQAIGSAPPGGLGILREPQDRVLGEITGGGAPPPRPARVPHPQPQPRGGRGVKTRPNGPRDPL